MLELRWIRENIETLKTALNNRGYEVDIEEFIEKDKIRREIIQKVEKLKHERNEINREIGKRKKSGEPADDLIEQSRQLGEMIASLDGEREALDAWIQSWIERLPNIPHPSVPIGKDASENVVRRTWGDIPAFDFEPRDHVELGHFLRILDLDRAARIAGSRFPLFKGVGARLVRALMTFMLDIHTREHGYQELWVPSLVNPDAMFGTGQLPKFHDDLYFIEKDQLYLIPTAEVPVTNFLREETLPETMLPLKFTAYTPCFRREAGTYGTESKGLIRQHQFDKVELVQITHPDASYEALEELTHHAETVLQRLGLPYRVVELCTGDLGFSAAKTYDLEVWLPSQKRWLEVSSCSNFESFQARRMGLRFRPKEGGKARYPHTLNGSGLAIGRTIVVLLENYQQEDGSVLIPEALRPYLDGQERLEPLSFPL